MQSKTISLFVVVQTLTLGFALLCAASAARAALAFRSQRAQSTYYPLKTFGGGAFLIVAFSIAAIAFAFGALLPLQTN